MALDILIVDDEAAIRELVAGLLGDEALETRNPSHAPHHPPVPPNYPVTTGVPPDIAPTLLDMLGVKQPAEMTGKSLLVRK